MNKVVAALLFLVIVLAYGGYYYRDYFVASAPQDEPITESEPTTDTEPDKTSHDEILENNDSTPDIEPVQMDQFLDFDNLESRCNIAATCGNLVGVNCQSEVDGPYYYAEKDTGKIVSYCGGYCLSPEGCNNCPPGEWVCNK